MTIEARANRERADAIVRQVEAISPSPSLLRLEARLRGGEASARELARLVEGSPALAARVLQVANSAYYAPPTPVVSLTRAATLLGDTVLRQLVLVCLIAVRHRRHRSGREALAEARLMGDAVRTAVIARALARTSRRGDADTPFALGLLHDVGQVYLLSALGERYADLLLADVNGEEILHREFALAGTTHEEVGHTFAYAWRLPEEFATVLGDHHRPRPGMVSDLIYLADRLARETSRPVIDPAVERARTDLALADLGYDRDRWTASLPAIRLQIEELLTIFVAGAG